MPKQSIEPHRTVLHGKVRWRVWIPKALQGERGKSRRFFETEKEANGFARELANSRNGLSGRFLALPAQTQSRLLLCLDRMKGDIEALEAAVGHAEAARVKLTKTVPGAILECITAKTKADRRSKYVVNLEVTLNQFAAGRETRSVSDISSTELENWLNGNGWAAETRRGYLTRLRTFFKWCKRKGFVAIDPTLAIERPSEEHKPPGILTLDECARLLKACREKDRGLLPYCALGLFAGIRPDEIKRLSWANIKDGCIEIPGYAAKKRQRRFVDIWPPLDAWLKLNGELPPGRNFAKRWAAVRTAAGVNWSHDCMRHSFCSYAYPIHGAAKTSLQAGNSEDTLFRDYRELVHKSEAEKFWKLLPKLVTKTGRISC